MLGIVCCLIDSAEVLVCKSAKNILPKFLVCHFFLQMAARILRLPLVKNVSWPIIKRWCYMISQVSDNDTADLIKLSLKKNNKEKSNF